MSKISVIVPVYKVEKYIHKCVDSILAQTFSDFELILVDDGSPDNCGKICDEYSEKDDRVVVLHKENGGLSDARNAGLDWVFEHSDSGWITFSDSDDWLRPTYLEALLNAADGKKLSICDVVSKELMSQITSTITRNMVCRQILRKICIATIASILLLRGESYTLENVLSILDIQKGKFARMNMLLI